MTLLQISDTFNTMKDTLPSEITKANRSVRSSGAVGKNSVIPKLVGQMFPKSFKMLDYGSGPARIHQVSLELAGFDVDAFDFGKNWREGMQYEVFPYRYDLIYASNVMNTWSTPLMVAESLEEIKNGLKDNGIFLANFPKSPRYSKDYTDEDIETILNSYFSEVRILPKNVYYCQK